MRFGHTYSKDHLFKLNIVEHQNCECGEENETVNHLIFSCKLFNENSRSNMMNQLALEKVQFPVNIHSLIHDMDLNTLDLIFEFIVEQNICF